MPAPIRGSVVGRDAILHLVRVQHRRVGAEPLCKRVRCTRFGVRLHGYTSANAERVHPEGVAGSSQCRPLRTLPALSTRT